MCLIQLFLDLFNEHQQLVYIIRIFVKLILFCQLLQCDNIGNITLITKLIMQLQELYHW